MINLDNNATTRPSPTVVAAVVDALETTWHNPSSIHRAGQEARRIVELARQSLAELIGVKSRTLTFTSGGTESIDLAIRGVLPPARASDPRCNVIVTTPVEHSAVRELCERLAGEQFGNGQGAARVETRLLPLDSEGLVVVDEVADLLDERVALCTVQWANNETGGVQPVRAIARACAAKGVVFHVDATQWIGKMPARVVGSIEEQEHAADASTLCCDMLTFSPHKFHGPKGVGVLYARPGVALRPLLHGAQELGRRGGTENVPGIAGAGEAARLAMAWLGEPSGRERLIRLRDRFENAVLKQTPGSRINGPRDPARRLWNTTNIAFPRLQAEALLLALSEQGLAASAGAACSSGSLDPSPVLLAMGIEPEIALGSLRFSLSRETTDEEIDQSVRIVVSAVQRLARSMPAG